VHAVVAGLSTGADTDTIVRALLDIEEIKQLEARYFRLLDTRCWDEWAQLFTVDCELRTMPDPDEVQTGREDFAAFPMTLKGYGHYLETYRREPEGWRIASLQLTRLRVDDVAAPRTE
jgi:hypothetical protein